MARARFRTGLLRLGVAIGLGGAATGAMLAAAGCGDQSKQAGSSRGKNGNSPAKAKLQQARAAARKGEEDRADALFVSAYKEDRKFSTLAERVRFLIAAGRAAKAVEVAKAFADDAPDNLKGQALYAEALIEAGQARAALDVTDFLLQLDAGSARHQALHGRALGLNARRQEGIEALRRALEIDSRDPEILLALGEALHQAGKVDEAALNLRTAVKLDAENPRAHVMLGAALRDQKEYDEARTTLRRAMELDPRGGRAYFELGILHNQVSEQADAEQALARAVELDPENTTYWYAYGQILHLRATRDPKQVDRGKLDLAINAYKRSLEIEPPHPKVAGKLALSLLDADRNDEAEVLLTGMLQGDPDNAQNYLYLGAVYAHARKYKLAIDTYEKFLVLAPKTDEERERVKRAILDLKRRL